MNMKLIEILRQAHELSPEELLELYDLIKPMYLHLIENHKALIKLHNKNLASSHFDVTTKTHSVKIGLNVLFPESSFSREPSVLFSSCVNASRSLNSAIFDYLTQHETDTLDELSLNAIFRHKDSDDE